MRSLRKRLEAVAKTYRAQTGLTSCASMECWKHATGEDILTTFRFCWFRPVGTCEIKNFPDVESLEDFVNRKEYQTEVENA